MAKQRIKVQGINIQILSDKEKDFICITDIAKNFEVGVAAIESWMRNRNTIEFLGTWEEIHNPNFNSVGFDGIKANVGLNSFKVSAKKWIKETNAQGLKAKAGRYGGTFAHRDIALQFCYWLSPSFQLYLIEEFQRLKEQEAKTLNIEWNIRRELAKAHYPMLKEAVIQHLPTGKKKAGFYLADEADLINELVFGMTAKQWRKKYPNLKGNMRDNATVEQLLLVSDLQIVDSLLIKWDCDKKLRTEILEKFANDLRIHFSDSVAVQRVKEIQDRALK